MSKNKTNVIRETNDEARELAKQLIRTARFGALAVNSGNPGFPSVSRTLVGLDTDGAPLILVSELSIHTKAIIADNRVSILLGEPGKGDPVAHPRISIACKANWIERSDPRFKNLRARFISRHPKAALYVDFADFRFYRLEPIAADLNGGFGKAFALSPDDFLLTNKTEGEFASIEEEFLAKFNNDHASDIDKITSTHLGHDEKNWHLIDIDCEGVGLAKSDRIIRINFTQRPTSAQELETCINNLANQG
ncbi:MAG: pyridoxamine 5'-phosphate oxidase family protein [Lentilitoribacter sp.]